MAKKHVAQAAKPLPIREQYHREAICRGALWDQAVCRRFGVEWDQLTRAQMAAALAAPVEIGSIPRKRPIKARFRVEAIYQGAAWVKAVCARFGAADITRLSKAQMRVVMAEQDAAA